MTHSTRASVTRRGAPLLWSAALALVALVASTTAVAAVNPAGNNGTVKIDGMPLDTGPGDAGPGDPDNEPHVGCEFAVDWYGFDEGDLFSSVTFQAWPPTGDTATLTPAVTGWRDPMNGDDAFGGDGRVYIGEDSNAGGGSAEGLDASVTFDLTDALASYTPHPQQGYHVKLTVNSDGSQGADRKHKVFWVGPCAGGEGGETLPGGDTGGEGGELGGEGGGATGGGGDVQSGQGGVQGSQGAGGVRLLPNTSVPATDAASLGVAILASAAASMAIALRGRRRET